MLTLMRLPALRHDDAVRRQLSQMPQMLPRGAPGHDAMPLAAADYAIRAIIADTSCCHTLT